MPLKDINQEPWVGEIAAAHFPRECEEMAQLFPELELGDFTDFSDVAATYPLVI